MFHVVVVVVIVVVLSLFMPLLVFLTLAVDSVVAFAVVVAVIAAVLLWEFLGFFNAHQCTLKHKHTYTHVCVHCLHMAKSVQLYHLLFLSLSLRPTTFIRCCCCCCRNQSFLVVVFGILKRNLLNNNNRGRSPSFFEGIVFHS